MICGRFMPDFLGSLSGVFLELVILISNNDCIPIQCYRIQSLHR